MPAVVVDTSVLISLAAGEQFRLLHDFYGVIYIPPEVWNEVAGRSSLSSMDTFVPHRLAGR